MYALAGKEEAVDDGCLCVVGGLLLLTVATLLPLLLFATGSSAEWYRGLIWITDGLLVSGLLLFFLPFSDKRTRYLLSFILLSCIVLQISLFRWVFLSPDDTALPAWSIRLRVGCAVVLVGLFLWTATAHAHRTRQHIHQFSLAISEQRVTIGKPFLISYTLSSTQATPIESLRILFSYQQYVHQYQQPYQECSIAVYQKTDWTSNPAHPLVEKFLWTIPAHLLPEDGTRKDWSLKVQIRPRKGVTRHLTYPLKVMWIWPESAAE